mmetsp:Transcript_51929/g.135556  ORF Transcript_51929/g.135556 Transcript_51929/m.135556 type:complete len:561 (-) Transcript_51929:415-2097(-)
MGRVRVLGQARGRKSTPKRPTLFGDLVRMTVKASTQMHEPDCCREKISTVSQMKPAGKDLGFQITRKSTEWEIAVPNVNEEADPAPSANCCCPSSMLLPMVSVFFADIVGFTSLAASMHPCEAAAMLYRLFARFDTLAKQHGVQPIDIIGDSYFAATNLNGDQSSDHAARLARFALDAVRAASETAVECGREDGGRVQVRVGLHCGPAASAWLGKRTLIGDTVNTASRMESTGRAGSVQCTPAMAALIAQQDPSLSLCPRGGPVELKGMGTMGTYWVMPAPASTYPCDDSATPIGSASRQGMTPGPRHEYEISECSHGFPPAHVEQSCRRSCHHTEGSCVDAACAHVEPGAVCSQCEVFTSSPQAHPSHRGDTLPGSAISPAQPHATLADKTSSPRAPAAHAARCGVSVGEAEPFRSRRSHSPRGDAEAFRRLELPPPSPWQASPRSARPRDSGSLRSAAFFGAGRDGPSTRTPPPRSATAPALWDLVAPGPRGHSRAARAMSVCACGDDGDAAAQRYQRTATTALEEGGGGDGGGDGGMARSRSSPQQTVTGSCAGWAG